MKIVNKLISLQIINKEDTDLYEYSISILINYIFFSLLILIGNLFTKNYCATFIFLFTFSLLRKYTGGLHLNRRITCLLLSVVLTLFVPYIANLFQFNSNFILISYLIISSIISILPIIEAPQKQI